MFALRARVH